MGKRGSRKPKKPVGDPNDPHGLYCWMMRYLEAMRVKNYSERTVENRESYLGFFILWCEARSITRPQEVTKPIIDRYQRHLFHMRKPSGKPLSFSAQIARLVPVRGFFKWLTRQNVLLWNPASEIELPKQEKRLPKHVLTADDAESVMLVPNVVDPIGLRDRAILETFYSTGIRRMELINLTVFDIDQDRGTLMVRQGKGKKDRMVPIGERAVTWIGKYIDAARPQLVLPPDPGTLFVTQEGDEISPHRMTQLVRTYIRAADIGKTGSCHLFRHTCATLMLEGGADIRYIQEMLGHVELSTTQIYTQVSIRKLKAVHTLTHPGAKVDRPAAADTEGDVPDDEDAGAQPDDQTSPTSPSATPDDPTTTLYATLAQEAEEEATTGP
jgi:integrase/recombinase XerD